jgi:hypothetical protein
MIALICIAGFTVGRDFAEWIIAANGRGKHAMLVIFLLWKIAAIYNTKDCLKSLLFNQPTNVTDEQATKYKISQLLRIIDELNLSLDVYKLKS